MAASCFSIYAFQELKKELTNLDELRFIFTSPTFTTEKAKKEKREFYIPRLNRERSLYGTEFEIKLRNELTQKSIAKECAQWIKRKVTFKSNVTDENMMGFIHLDNKSYMPINGFTTVDLGCERGNNAYCMIQKIEAPFSNAYLELFDNLWNDSDKLQDVTDEVIDNITAAYNENSPDFIYFVTLYNIFNEFLEDISEDVLPNEATEFKESKIWNMLYNFQKDAALAIINKLEKYNGCILADSVGLGKTFTALAVIKYYENRNKSVLVLCPKKLGNNWKTYKDNYVNNPVLPDEWLTKLNLLDWKTENGFIFGLIFLISSCLIVVYIAYFIKEKASDIYNRLTRNRRTMKRLIRLNYTQLAIICKLYNSDGYTTTFNYSEPLVQALLAEGYIYAGGEQLVSVDTRNNVIYTKFTLQPFVCWALDHYKPSIEKHIKKIEDKVAKEKDATKKARLADELSNARENYKILYGGY